MLAGARHNHRLCRRHNGRAHDGTGRSPSWLALGRAAASAITAVTAAWRAARLRATGAASQGWHNRHRRYDKQPSHLRASFRRRLQVGNQLYNAVCEVQIQPVIFFDLALRFFNARSLIGSYICLSRLRKPCRQAKPCRRVAHRAAATRHHELLCVTLASAVDYTAARLRRTRLGRGTATARSTG